MTDERSADDARSPPPGATTSLSFARSYAAADRTLLAVIRTAMSLIGFGFTISFALRKLPRWTDGHFSDAPRNLGFALVLLGIVTLVLGLVTRWRNGADFQGRGRRLRGLGLIEETGRPRIDFAIVAALLALLVGFAALAAVIFDLDAFDQL